MSPPLRLFALPAAVRDSVAPAQALPGGTAASGAQDPSKLPEDTADFGNLGSTKEQRGRLAKLLQRDQTSASMGKAFKAMSNDDRNDFLTVAESLTPGEFRFYLPHLLTDRDINGKLLLDSKSSHDANGHKVTDPSKGTTLIHELALLATTPIDPALLPKLNLIDKNRNLFRHTGEPGGNVTPAAVMGRHLLAAIFRDNVVQGDAETCASDGVESVLDMLQGAEFARVVRETFTKGEVELAGGYIMTRNDDGIETDGALGMINAVLQGSFMDIHNPNHFVWHEAADAGGDHGERQGYITMQTTAYAALPLGWKILWTILFPVGIYLGIKKVDRPFRASDGTDYNHVAITASLVTGKPYRVLTIDDGSLPVNAKDQLAFLKRLSPDGNTRKLGIISCWWFSRGGHAMRLDGVDATSTPPAVICRTGNFHNEAGAKNADGSAKALYKAGDRAPGFDYEATPGPEQFVTINDPQQTNVRVPLTDAFPVKLSALIVPEDALKPSRL